MKLLIIGSGGREHALSKKLLEDDKVTTVYCAKGNPGMKRDGIEIVDIAEDDHPSLIQFAKDKGIAWTFVGPEVPLLNGIVDDFQAAGLKIYGPNQAAAFIEGSKEFAKELMTEMGIPTAAYETFSDFEAAKTYVLSQGAPIVIKADGLAAGKGVVVAETVDEAIAALREMLEEQKFGESSARVVIEEFLVGEEFSLLAFVDGDCVYPMVIAQDHKRAYDGDQGPNTGGMGAYTPVPQIPESMVEQAVKEVLYPTVQGMILRGTPYHGILYAGLIATTDGPKVIEFNARFGDPETQVVLARLNSSLADIISDLIAHRTPKIEWNNQASVGVVVAASGYPVANETKGVFVPNLEDENTAVFYAGVAENEGTLVSNGGRVLLVEGHAATIAKAQEKVYRALEKLETKELFYRQDIGHKALT
ncbi:phosphoribosylamine--glycine ligase [Enterococcus sp. LJL98]